MLGLHISDYKRTGSVEEASTGDAGFYGGVGGGAMYSFNEKLFVNIEYEWAYLSNSYYRDGYMNSAMLGVGYNF